ncbi:zinc finger protein 62 homolog [Penaeus monodon]|uniref:zinc finger protein 62 homolog n=1 Tax=Penaeus monodon TaxID=6687 RepID=UPI0018A7A12D|nr:zinc finger protein 62 homolog [Penaeus monodon]
MCSILRKDDLWYHQEIAHTEGKGRAKTAFKDRTYACEECGETFLFKYKLKMHINSKHLNDAGQNANDFTCGECGCKLGSLPGLTFHMRKHHNKSLTYRKTTEYLCSDCGFMAPSNKKLREHQEAHCGSSTKPKVQCEICGKTVLKVSLKMHKVKMHSEFKEQCDRCGERYATKTDLLRHINVVHLRILLYNCQYCGERFATSDALRYHRVKMHEKPSFYCQICGKCYKRVGELNTHIKRAHNDRRKAEVCTYCGKEYYDRSKLRNHLVSKHNIPQEMTYSENYLRKKRVDGLPLAKHMEKRSGMEQKMTHMVPQHQQHPHMRPVVDEAAEAARNLGAYQEITTTEDDNSLVVTEITEAPAQVEQTVLVDPLSVPQGMMHHPQVAHMQPPMTMHHPMHQQMHHHAAMSRLGVLYQMNMHHPGPSHLNMTSYGHIVKKHRHLVVGNLELLVNNYTKQYLHSEKEKLREDVLRELLVFLNQPLLILASPLCNIN